MAETEATIQYGILLFIWLSYFWKLYLSSRQYMISKKTLQVPQELSVIVKQDIFVEARKYSLDKQKFGFINDLFEALAATVVICSDILGNIWTFSENTTGTFKEVPVSCFWTLCVLTISTVISLPVNTYYHFVLEEKYGFNNQTLGFFLKDEVKSFVLSLFIYLPVAVASTLIVQYGGALFFIWLWFAIGTMYFLLMAFYPFYIAPFFDEFTPLPEGELRSEIENLASQLHFPLDQIYVVNESKRSTHSNAYYAGLFKTKRIVIYDNLLENSKTGGCKTDEILAVLTHELGHWKLGHLTQKLILAQINLLITSAIFQVVYYFPSVYTAFGFYNLNPVIPGLLITVQYLVPYNVVVSILKGCLFDKMEHEADEFGVQMGRTDALIRAMVKTHEDNLDFPIYDGLYCAWYHSHATVIERIAALESKPTS